MNQLQPSDRELLVRLDERVAQLLYWSKNHDKKHDKTNNRVYAALSLSLAALLGAILNFIFGN